LCEQKWAYGQGTANAVANAPIFAATPNWKLVPGTNFYRVDFERVFYPKMVPGTNFGSNTGRPRPFVIPAKAGIREHRRPLFVRSVFVDSGSGPG
jgi:hypothetical protein